MSRNEAPSGDGLVTILKDVVQASEKYQKSVSYLLDGVAVVDSIRTALKFRADHPGWTFVTTDGDTLTAEGILTGGASEGADSGVLKRRREIKELSEKKSEWAGKLALAQASLKKIESQLESVVTDFESAQKRKMEQEIKVTELKKDLERAGTEIQNATYACERQDRELAKISQQLQSLEDRLVDLQSSMEETRIEKMQAEERTSVLDKELSSIRGGR